MYRAPASRHAQEFGLDVTRSAALSILPWGVNVVCTNLAGWLGDKAINERGLDRTLVRKVMQGIASLGPAACLLALASDQGAPPVLAPACPAAALAIVKFSPMRAIPSCQSGGDAAGWFWQC